jgi:mono/diheme cytochrome c family protein
MLSRSALLLLLASSFAHSQLVATFSREGSTDTRMDRFPALSVPEGQPATPFLSPGRFEVTWTGKLVVSQRQRLSFSFDGSGGASLKIAGKEVLSRQGELAGEASEVLRLNAGEHEIELSYSSNADGSAAFRLFWEELSFPRQSIPPSAFRAEATADSQQGDLQRAGRMIVTQQNCVKCHASEAGLGVNAMPETGEIGPILVGAGDRTTEEWLRRWISAPHVLNPNSHMPALVDPTTTEGRQQASDLAAYLSTLKLGAPTGEQPDPALAKDGGVHFHELGCVACHNPPDSGVADPNRVPLNNVASKYLPGALVSFLKKPDAFHPFSKMPDFQLSDEEAQALASYLTETSAGRETKIEGEFPPGDAGRGAKVAEALHCGSCHPGLPIPGTVTNPSLETILKKDWMDSGCAAPSEKRGKVPVLNLTDEDRAALDAFAKTGGESLRRDSPAEFATRQMEAQRCTSCHTLDGQPSLLSGLHGTTRPLIEHLPHLEERVDQTRPHLTFVGEMLYTSYLESILRGTADPRPRPWLGMRMPAYRAHASPLAEGLSRLHGLAPNAPEKLQVDPALAQIGGLLVGTEGFGCNTCHGLGGEKATAAFEVEGINLALSPDRLREEFYHRWMDHPNTITPGTKMPRYSDGSKSQRGDVLEGDARAQFDAIWHFLHGLE